MRVLGGVRLSLCAFWVVSDDPGCVARAGGATTGTPLVSPPATPWAVPPRPPCFVTLLVTRDLLTLAKICDQANVTNVSLKVTNVMQH